jgi:hypothetical protein
VPHIVHLDSGRLWVDFRTPGGLKVDFGWLVALPNWYRASTWTPGGVQVNHVEYLDSGCQE